MGGARIPVTVHRIYAGKLRRYHGISILRQLLDIQTTLLNFRDAFFILIGIIQTFYYAMKWQPDVIFTKGGFVCLPAGIVARILGIPLVTHDSDMRPGLTNRIISRWASAIATGAPIENYPYDPKKTHFVGVPIDSSFRPFTLSEQLEARHEYGFIDIERPLVVATGGGLGARRINEAIVAIAPELTKHANILHITGQRNYNDVVASAPELHEYEIVPFIHTGMVKVLGAADVVVTRASATTLLELAGLAKPTIAIPSAVLGDQLKNGNAYAEAGAVILCEETTFVGNPQKLSELILSLLRNSKKRQELSQRIHQLARPHAAIDTAALIVAAMKDKK